jgi:ParB-like chromosome segregation protein Spo0J
MKIALTKLRIDGDTQPRAMLNQDIIAEYAEHLMNEIKMPAITVFHDSANYWIADGFHRFFAAKRTGATEIECEVVQGTLREAQLFSVGANATHGLRRTSEDKKKAVLTLLNDLEWAEWSDREIARKCNVDHTTVGRIKKSLNLDQMERTYKDKHGNISKMKMKEPSEVSTLKPVEQMEDPKMQELEVAHQELAAAHVELAEVNEQLMDRVAIAAMDATPEEKAQAEETIADLRIQLKTVTAELNAIKVSRDQYQAKAAEMAKQITYWKKRAEKAESQLEKAAA